MRDVDLIRHAYVLPSAQGRGIGGILLRELRLLSSRRMLVGTWAAAGWAIGFYRKHGFELVPSPRKVELLQTYWTVPARRNRDFGGALQPAIRHLEARKLDLANSAAI